MKAARAFRATLPSTGYFGKLQSAPNVKHQSHGDFFLFYFAYLITLHVLCVCH